MSAENVLTMRRMNNGQFWLINMATGNTVLECYGNGSVISMFDTYKAARAELEFVACEEVELGYVDQKTGKTVWTGIEDRNDRYMYSEYGVEIPSFKEIMREPPMLISGSIHLEFGDRKCDCFDERDLNQKKWRVVERCHWTDEGRVLDDGLSYARAMNIAHQHHAHSIGDITLQLPQYFRSFTSYDHHDCFADNWSINTFDETTITEE